MNNYYTSFIIIVLIVLGPGFSAYPQSPPEAGLILWYDTPANEWMEALPVGNGRLGAMVFGRPVDERIQLNEDSMWPGSADWGDSRGTPDDLQKLRALLKKGNTRAVDSLIVERFSYKSVLRSHQTMGDLYINFHVQDSIQEYQRSLDLEQAVASVQYVAGGYEYRREVFTSYPDDVLAIRLTTKNPGGMDFDLWLNRPADQGHPTATVTIPSDSTVSMRGMVTQYGGVQFSDAKPLDYGVSFDTQLKVRLASGSSSVAGDKLEVRGTREAVLFLSCKTSFYHPGDFYVQNNHLMRGLAGRKYEQIKADHLKDFGKLFSRTGFSLGEDQLYGIPTNKRLELIKSGGDDAALQAMLFHYGRYLLISSSRQGSNPANLQGIWNEHIQAPWNADYHLNINLQMNYWPANLTSLGELNDPYFNFIDRALARGKVTARQQYGMDGSVVHHATDLWAPAWMRAERPYWGSWIHGGGWAVQHYWEHFRFSRDTAFLRNRAYPALKAVSEFYRDWLVWDEDLQSWVSSPETSPENSYYTETGEAAAVSYGSAMGHQIIAEVFDNFMEASKILGISDELTLDIKTKRESLFPGVVVGDDGRVLEWNRPYREPEPGHRHISQLYALYPGTSITIKDSVAFEAAQKTIDYRLQHGGAGTGWSRALMINMNARLLDSVALQENIGKFLEISIAPNLFDEHPPFQIDGNFGYTAGVVEALIQSHEEFIRLLPALPANWPDGSVRGIKARGNITVSMQWADGALLEAGLFSEFTQECKVRYNGRVVDINLPPGQMIRLGRNLGQLKP